MSSLTPPQAVIDTAVGAGGLVHVSVFLAQAFDQLSPALLPRSDLHKCAGAGLAICNACARQLAPVGAGQQWTSPRLEHGVCSVLADVDRYLGLYTARPTAQMPEVE
jgi:hypothetical protein